MTKEKNIDKNKDIVSEEEKVDKSIAEEVKVDEPQAEEAKADEDFLSATFYMESANKQLEKPIKLELLL